MFTFPISSPHSQSAALTTDMVINCLLLSDEQVINISFHIALSALLYVLQLGLARAFWRGNL